MIRSRRCRAPGSATAGRSPTSCAPASSASPGHFHCLRCGRRYGFREPPEFGVYPPAIRALLPDREPICPPLARIGRVVLDARQCSTRAPRKNGRHEAYKVLPLDLRTPGPAIRHVTRWRLRQALGRCCRPDARTALGISTRRRRGSRRPKCVRGGGIRNMVAMPDGHRTWPRTGSTRSPSPRT
jgi:hypothetical protein